MTNPLKIHIGSGTHGTSYRAMGKAIGFDPDILEQVIEGDIGAIQDLSAKAEYADRINKILLPALEQALKAIKATADLNAAKAQLLKAGNTAALSIVKSLGSATLSEQQLINKLEEIKTSVTNSKEYEGIRHARQMKTIDASHAVKMTLGAAAFNAQMNAMKTSAQTSLGKIDEGMAQTEILGLLKQGSKGYYTPTVNTRLGANNQAVNSLSGTVASSGLLTNPLGLLGRAVLFFKGIPGAIAQRLFGI